VEGANKVGLLTFIISLLVVLAFMYAGYRLSMYLYERGAFRSKASQRFLDDDGWSATPVRETIITAPMSEIVADHGVRYIRVAFLVIAGVALLIVAALIIAVYMVLH
jgi:hypothetical protein